jgi:hypothetical protein
MKLKLSVGFFFSSNDPLLTFNNILYHDPSGNFFISHYEA